MKVTKITFTHERDTKGAHRFQEDAKEGEHVVGNLYIRKDKVEGERPDKIEMTLKPVK